MPRDEYGSYGSVPTTPNQGVSGANLNVRASPDTFGAKVGEAASGFGRQVQEIGDHFGQIVTEAKVNDDYANKYIPQATQLKSQYDSLRGQDKIAGYDNYINNLNTLNKQFIESQPGLLGQKAMSGMTTRYTSGEVTGAKSELVASQKIFADKAAGDTILANLGVAAQNYNNPQIVDSVEQQNDNHVLIQSIDNGVDPNDEIGKSLIADAQKNTKGQMATGMIQKAFNSGDAVSANALRAHYSDWIPGYQKLALDSTLHTQNIQITSKEAGTALMAGKPIPSAIGAPEVGVQALVANTAKRSEVDPNHALTVLRIESSNGQNLGSRGTLGQDKESAGKPLDEQAKVLCDNLKTASLQASAALSRPSEPWETYVVYQQGAGGGPALLKGAQENPNANAVEVLSKFYKSPKDALSAVNGNGGNSTMSASDFVDHIKQVYNDNAKRANCDFGDTDNPGEAIIKPHQTIGVTVQPAASPVQTWLNFEKKYTNIQIQINAIPNYEVREGIARYIEGKRQEYARGASIYKNVLVNQAAQLAVDPKFISSEMIPPEMRAALATDNPDSLKYLDTRAEYNHDKATGNNTKDMREYGAGFYNLFNKVHSLGDDKINSIAELQKHVGQDGDLTIAGYDRLSKELAGKNTPEGDSIGIAKKNFLALAKQQISGQDDILRIRDPKGEENYQRFLSAALPAYDQGIAEGKSAIDLLNPDSKDYIGKTIPSFKRTLAEQMADMEKASEGLVGIPSQPEKIESGMIASAIHNFASLIGAIPEKSNVDINTPEGLRNALITGKITRQEAEAEAIKRGYVRPKINTPLAQ